MTAIDFPNSPTIGDTFTVGDITWEWTGSVWQGLGTAVPGPAGAPGVVAATAPATYDSETQTVGVTQAFVNQTNQTFADAAARTAAIPTPSEGMVTYLNDTDALEVFNGTSFVPAAPASGGSGNAIINGAFEINQRGFTSTTVNGQFIFDRWQAITSGGTATYTSETFSIGEVALNGANTFIRIATSGQSAADHSSRLLQRIENVSTFANQTVTVSFFARAASGTPNIAVYGTQNFGSGGSATADINGQKTTITTSLQRVSFTFDVPSITGKTVGAGNFFGLFIATSAGSDFNARTDSLGIQNATIDIWGVQVEAGSTATDFRRNANSLQGELAACQRYYWRITPEAGRSVFTGLVDGSTFAIFTLTLPVTMRVPPNALEQSGTAADYGVRHSAGVTTPCSVVPSLGACTDTTATLSFTVASGLTAGQSCLARLVNSNAFLGWSAEL